MKEDEDNLIFEYQQFLKKNNTENPEKAQSEINNNDNKKTNEVNNNVKTEIENAYLDKKKIQYGFVNKQEGGNEKMTVEEDTKGKTEEQTEYYQMSGENGDFVDLFNEYYDVANVEVNNDTQKSYKLVEDQKSEFSDNNSQSMDFDNDMNSE